jgi:transcriptional regulator with XRE-family HTH domain
MDIQKVIALLQSKGMTQLEIGSSIGCTQANISAFARGKHGSIRPSSKVVDGLRKLLAEHGLSAVVEEIT